MAKDRSSSGALVLTSGVANSSCHPNAGPKHAGSHSNSRRASFKLRYWQRAYNRYLINVGDKVRGYREIVALEIVFTQAMPGQFYQVFPVNYGSSN